MTDVRNSYIWPKIIGHRGNAGTAPENTLISFRDAYDSGVRAVEFDVVLAKDGVPMVFHDQTLDRTTNGTGPVWEKTSQELKELDAGSWFLPQFAGERIATLEETLTLCVALGLYITLELRPQPGLEAKTAETAVEWVRHIWPKDRMPPLFASFSIDSLQTVRAMEPDWPRSLMLDVYPQNWREMIEEADPTTLHANGARSPTMLLQLVATARPVYVYTVNEMKRARSLFALGIAGIITDYPAQLAQGNLHSPIFGL